MFELMMSSVGGTVAQDFFNAGRDAEQVMDYTTAIENYKKAVFFDIENGEALFALANAYRLNGDKANAKETFTLVVERFPESENATRARSFLEQIGD